MIRLALLALAGAVATGVAVDPTKLPVGDGKYTNGSPKKGYVYSCGPHNGGGGSRVNGPWIHGSTWDSTAKVTVGGNVRWSSTTRFTVSGGKLRITGNGLPGHTTGIFPVQASDDAYRYDPNPNRIAAQNLDYTLPASPRPAARPSCFSGQIGVMLTGAVLFDALDAQGRDAPAHEVQDHCDGHPERTGQYHYHSLSACADVGSSQTAHSKLVGYALDGFGIFGPRGEGGKVLSTADLDICHGHTHVISWHGRRVRMYHYHATADFPYTLSCFRGTPVRTGPPG